MKQGGLVGFLGRKIYDKKEKTIDLNALRGTIGIGMMVVVGISMYLQSVSTPSQSLKNLIRGYPKVEFDKSPIF